MPDFTPEGIFDFFFRRLPESRAGFNIWTDESRDQRQEAIRLLVAPQSISFKQLARISEERTKDGRAFFFWRKDRDSSHLDLLEMTVSGFTHSLMVPNTLRGSIGVLPEQVRTLTRSFSQAAPEDANALASRKQESWLRLWRMTREPFVMDTRLNRAHIQIQTPSLPTEIEFIGHFQNPLEWKHDAQQPYLVQWSFTMIVHRTNPDLDYFAQSTQYLPELTEQNTAGYTDQDEATGVVVNPGV